MSQTCYGAPRDHSVVMQQVIWVQESPQVSASCLPLKFRTSLPPIPTRPAPPRSGSSPSTSSPSSLSRLCSPESKIEARSRLQGVIWGFLENADEGAARAREERGEIRQRGGLAPTAGPLKHEKGPQSFLQKKRNQNTCPL